MKIHICFFCGRSQKEVGKINRFRDLGVKKNIGICQICRWRGGWLSSYSMAVCNLRNRLKNSKYRGEIKELHKAEMTKETWNTMDIPHILREREINFDNRFNSRNNYD